MMKRNQIKIDGFTAGVGKLLAGAGIDREDRQTVAALVCVALSGAILFVVTRIFLNGTVW